MARHILITMPLLAAYAATAAQLIDKSTTAITATRLYDSKKLTLVMSDEFNKPGRSFAKGDDPNFEAVQKPDDSNQAMEFCKLSN
jgi:beta-glucanase (GH16 family)